MSEPPDRLKSCLIFAIMIAFALLTLIGEGLLDLIFTP